MGGTAQEWTEAIASIRAFQNAGGVVVWANSNYGDNDIANGAKGLDDVDFNAGTPLSFPELQSGWIAVVNATSIGLGIQANGQGYVDASTKKEGNIILNSAKCGIAANFCLSHDGVAMWAASNKGVTSYESQTGTSQATPQVAGMIALLREAFPTASAADLAARLLYTADNSFFVNDTATPAGETETTATYTNANGSISHTVSSIWGHGFANMQKALNPVGTTTTVTSSGRVVPLSTMSRSLSFGNLFGGAALSGSAGRFVYNDQLNGIFLGHVSDFASTNASRILESTVGRSQLGNSMLTATDGKGFTVSFSQAAVPDGASNGFRRDSVFSLTQSLNHNVDIGFGWGLNADQQLGFAPRHSNIRAASFTDRTMGLAPLNMIGDRQNWISSRFQSNKLHVAAVVVSSNERQQIDGMPGKSQEPGCGCRVRVSAARCVKRQSVLGLCQRTQRVSGVVCGKRTVQRRGPLDICRSRVAGQDCGQGQSDRQLCKNVFPDFGVWKSVADQFQQCDI